MCLGPRVRAGFCLPIRPVDALLAEPALPRRRCGGGTLSPGSHSSMTLCVHPTPSCTSGEAPITQPLWRWLEGTWVGGGPEPLLGLRVAGRWGQDGSSPGPSSFLASGARTPSLKRVPSAEWHWGAGRVASEGPGRCARKPGSCHLSWSRVLFGFLTGIVILPLSLCPPPPPAKPRPGPPPGARLHGGLPSQFGQGAGFAKCRRRLWQRAKERGAMRPRSRAGAFRGASSSPSPSPAVSSMRRGLAWASAPSGLDQPRDRWALPAARTAQEARFPSAWPAGRARQGLEGGPGGRTADGVGGGCRRSLAAALLVGPGQQSEPSTACAAAAPPRPGPAPPAGGRLRSLCFMVWSSGYRAAASEGQM